MSLKKQLLFIFAILLSVSVVAGCGKPDQKDPANGGKQPGSTQITPVPVTPKCDLTKSDGVCPKTCDLKTDADCKTIKTFGECDEVADRDKCEGGDRGACGAPSPTPGYFDHTFCLLRCDPTKNDCPEGSVCTANNICLPTCNPADTSHKCPIKDAVNCIPAKTALAGTLITPLEAAKIKGVCFDSTEDQTCDPSANTCPTGKKCTIDKDLPLGNQKNHCFDFGSNSTAAYGDPCSTAADCSGGLNAVCEVTGFERFSKDKKGYCSIRCEDDTACKSLNASSRCIKARQSDQFGVCEQTCETNPNECNAVPGTFCAPDPASGNKKLCESRKNCESDQTPGSADATKCRTQQGETCQKEGKSFYCHPPTLCANDTDPKKGDNAKCSAISGSSCQENEFGWFCLPDMECDNAGHPDDSLCDRNNFDYCETVGGKNKCVRPISCASDTDPTLSDKSKCSGRAQCTRLQNRYICIPPIVEIKCNNGNQPDQSACPQGLICTGSNGNYLCKLPAFCLDNTGQPNNNFCKDLNGSVCSTQPPIPGICIAKP